MRPPKKQLLFRIRMKFMYFLGGRGPPGRKNYVFSTVVELPREETSDVRFRMRIIYFLGVAGPPSEKMNKFVRVLSPGHSTNKKGSNSAAVVNAPAVLAKLCVLSWPMHAPLQRPGLN